jgi:enoyl-CoA hydratase/carnithine racemase
LEFENLTYEARDGVAQITMSRPEKLNALSQELLADLRAVLDAITVDDEIHCVILTGSGRAFSSGFDLTPPGRDANDENPLRTTEGTTAMIKSNFDTLIRIWNLRQPVIAAVNGHAIAAGCDLALVCDITLASAEARFGEPENRHLALSPLMIGPYVGPFKQMHEFYYTGDTVDAETAASWGIVNRVVPPEQLLAEAWRVATRIARVPSYSTFMTKSSLRRTYELMGFRQAQDQHRLHDTLVIGAVGIEAKDRMMTALREEGLKAFLELRDGPFRD